MGNGILIDISKCIGCKQCQIACMKSKNLPVDTEVTRLSPYAPSVVEMRNLSADKNKPQIQPVKRQCMNCLNPGCVSACTVGALTKRPDGPVVYDSNRCIGCRYCMYACPFGVPTFEWTKQFSLIRKCDGCADRIDQGKIPACAEACPAGALTYGNRNDLLTIAKDRGIHVRESRSAEPHDFASLVTVTVRGAGGETSVAGTVYGKRDARIVRVGAFRVEAVPDGNVIVCENDDAPGVVGNLGTALGAAGVNIARISLSRLDDRSGAFSFLNVDAAPSPEVLEALRRLPHVRSVRSLRL